MKSTTLNYIAAASGLIVLDGLGQLKQLEPGEKPLPGELVVSIDNGEPDDVNIEAQLIGDNALPQNINIDDEIAQVLAQIEQGEDPTQNEDFATAAGGEIGSSPTGSGDIERTGAETLAFTNFETSGLEAQGLTELQSLALGELLVEAFAIISGDENVEVDETDAPIETGGAVDVDIEEVSFLPIENQPGDNNYGLFSIDEEGNWTFVANEAFDELNVGDSYVDTITVSTTDDTETTITVTINGTDDVPELVADTGSVTEDVDVVEGNLSASGTLEPGTGGDGGEDKFVAADIVGLYGSLSVDEDGNWEYFANNSQVAIQELDQGESIDDVFTVLNADGVTETTVTITINGAEDPSDITVGEGDSDEGSVIEDVDVTLAETLVSEGSLTITDVDANDNPEFNPNGVFTPTGSTNAAALGSLVIDADGDWTYTVDNNAVQYLDEGESVTEIYTVSATDGTEHVVTITINGAEDPSDITVGEGDSDEGSVTEDVDVTLAETLVSEGSLTITDVDANDNPEFNPNGVFTPAGSTNAAALGSLVIDADGDWTYTVDNSAVQYLDEGESVTEIYTVSATDGTEHVVTITINGAEDPSDITVGEGDSDEGSVTEDVNVTLAETLVSEGSLTISDVDANDNPEFNPNGVFTPTGSTNAAALGSLVIDADGDWTYTVDNNAVQYLDEGESVTEIYTVSATDGTEHVVTITINGAEDPSDITVGEGDSDEGSVTEDVDVTLAETLVSEGSLTISDVDANDNPEFNPNGVFTPTGSTNAAALGSLVIDADGDWTYTVDNNAVQYLDEGETVTEIYTVSATDGTEHVVTITINGAEDPSDITVGEGDSDEGSVTEDVDVTLAETLVSEGSLTISDVDASDNPEFNPNGVFTPTGSTNAAALGSLVIDADGDWTYTVDNNAVQYLDEGESVTEIYTVSATDGTEHVVTITINGAEDPSDITVGEGDSDEGSVTEDVDVTLADTLVSEGSLTITDVDANDNPEFNPNGVFTPTGSTNAAALGSLVIDADGDWTYTVDNNAVQYLDEGESVTEIYTVSATDGTEHVVTITINGAEDPSDITVGEGDSDEGSVTEDVDVTLAETLVSEGSLTISDVDANDNPEFNPNGVFTPTGSTNAAALGSLVIDADGDWTYTVDNNAVQYLDEGESVTEIYTVSATDGTEHVVTITINGAEDPSDITVGEGDSDEGSVTEDVNVTLAETLVSEGSLTISDVDANDNPEFNPNGVFTPTGSTNAAALGSLVIDADGDWTYTVDNNAVQYLDEGETVTEIYTVSATDGTEHVVTITINGAEDPSDITVGEGDSDEGSVTEDVDVTLAETLVSEGSLTISDVDANDNPEFNPNGVFTPTGSTNAAALGSLVIDADGDWTYTVDNNAVQYLDEGESVTEIYTVSATDGTEHVVTITINGAEDPSDITVGEGDSDEGSVTEDVDVTLAETLVSEGSLTITDVDANDNPEFNPNGVFTPTGSTNAAALGSLVIDADGDWTYTVDNNAVQYLDEGESVTEIYTVSATDGTEHVVTITINGAEDPSDITVGEGDSDEGSVTEDVDVTLAETLVSEGSLTITDVDANDNPEFNPNGVFTPAGSTNAVALGSLVIDTDGDWTYTVDNSAVQYLDEGESVTEIYTVSATDGTEHVVTITINGAEDPSDITVGEGDSDEGSVTEDVDVTLADTLVSEGSLTISDVDANDNPEFNPNGVFTPTGSTNAAALGSLVIDADGDWTYTVDNNAVQYLDEGETVTEIYTVSSTDGVTHQISVVIHGDPDNPQADSFEIDLGDVVVTPIVFNSDNAAYDFISDVEDDYNSVPLHILVNSLPESGTLLYTDPNGVTREITSADVSSETQFEQDSISYVPGEGELFTIGIREDPTEDTPMSDDGFYNWGEKVSDTERLVTLDNGKEVRISITDNNDKPLKQYTGDKPHVGYGIGDNEGSGMNMQEALHIDLSDNPLDVVTLGLDGMGGEFNSNSSVKIVATYTLENGDIHTEEYQKDVGDTGNSQILYEFSYSSPDNPIVDISLSSTGGNWELRYLEGAQEITENVTFDYQAIDSNGDKSTQETVTINVLETDGYNVVTAADNEPLNAELGNDLLIGDDGENIFTWLDSTLDSGTDVVKDFTVGQDLIDLNDLLDDPNDPGDVMTLLNSIDVTVGSDDVTLSVPSEGGGFEQSIVIENITTDLASLESLDILSQIIKNDAA